MTIRIDRKKEERIELVNYLDTKEHKPYYYVNITGKPSEDTIMFRSDKTIIEISNDRITTFDIEQYNTVKFTPCLKEICITITP